MPKVKTTDTPIPHVMFIQRLLCESVPKAEKHKRKRKRTFIDTELLEQLHAQHVSGWGCEWVCRGL